FRIHLTAQAISQEEKLFSPPIKCDLWNQVDEKLRQLQVFYSVFWKAKGDDQSYYSFSGNKIFNWAELRTE
ncbi:MAG: hypothetical protein ACKN9V_08290, partial [Pseudomonadota bacterium]